MPTVTFAHLDAMMRIVVEPSDEEARETVDSHRLEGKAGVHVSRRGIEEEVAGGSTRTAAEPAPPEDPED